MNQESNNAKHNEMVNGHENELLPINSVYPGLGTVSWEVIPVKAGEPDDKAFGMNRKKGEKGNDQHGPVTL